MTSPYTVPGKMKYHCETHGWRDAKMFYPNNHSHCKECLVELNKQYQYKDPDLVADQEWRRQQRLEKWKRIDAKIQALRDDGYSVKDISDKLDLGLNTVRYRIWVMRGK